jgi:hypothetical protein
MTKEEKLDQYLESVSKYARGLGMEPGLSCFCGFVTKDFKLQPFIDHLVEEHNYSREDLNKDRAKVIKDARRMV